MFEKIQNLVNNSVKTLTRVIMVNGIGNPYKQFTFTIADGAQQTLFYDFNYFRILSANVTTGVTVRFGSSGTPTDVVGAGIGYEMPAVVGRADIANNSGGTLTITVAVAIGRIDDDRLNVSGAINVARAAVLDTIDDVTLAGATATLIAPSNPLRNELFVTNMSGGDIRVGDSNVAATSGFRIADGATIIMDGIYAVYGYSVAGGDVSISETEF